MNDHAELLRREAAKHPADTPHRAAYVAAIAALEGQARPADSLEAGRSGEAGDPFLCDECGRVECCPELHPELVNEAVRQDAFNLADTVNEYVEAWKSDEAEQTAREAIHAELQRVAASPQQPEPMRDYVLDFITNTPEDVTHKRLVELGWTPPQQPPPAGQASPAGVTDAVREVVARYVGKTSRITDWIVRDIEAALSHQQPAPSVSCFACEGKPAAENNPCILCGTVSEPAASGEGLGVSEVPGDADDWRSALQVIGSVLRVPNTLEDILQAIDTLKARRLTATGQGDVDKELQAKADATYAEYLRGV